MKRFAVIILLFFITIPTFKLFSSRLITVAEESNYSRTSTYNEVMTFLFSAQQQSDQIKIIRFATSYEGRMLPLAVISSEGIKSARELAISGKPAILIMANIHAGEIEGKEAMMMFIQDVVEKKANLYLENQVLLVLPIFNADGNDKFGKNRDDNGPELAGVRYNGQRLDLNRDYLKMESPEVQGLVQLLETWDPILVVDMHTTNGSYHRNPVTYSTGAHPNTDPALVDFMWKQMFPAVSQILKNAYGYDSIPYGNFVDNLDPSKGWTNDTELARYGTNYIALRNRFTILDENYSHADYKTRVLSSYSFVKSILEFTRKNIKHMKELSQAADMKTINSFCKDKFCLESKNEILFDITVKSYVFEIVKIKPEEQDKFPPWIKDYYPRQTETFKDYTIPYFAQPVPTKTISIPEAYIIGPNHPEVIEKIKKHGIIVERISKEFKTVVDVFKTEEISLAKQLYQGHVTLTLKGSYGTEERTIPANSYFISMKQPLARLIPVLLEPESVDSLAAWGFFNRELVEQWFPRPNVYPVFRIFNITVPIERYQE